jgi:hypothetical protein
MGRQGEALVYREHTWDKKIALVRELYRSVLKGCL